MNTVNENVIVLIVETAEMSEKTAAEMSEKTAAEMSERNGNRNARNAIRKAIR